MKGTDEPGCKSRVTQKPNRDETREEASLMLGDAFALVTGEQVVAFFE